MKLARFLHSLFDPARIDRPVSAWHATVEVGPLCAQRLEERRVLACDALNCHPDDAVNDDGSIQPQTVSPLVTVPGNQTAVEGSPLIFSAATGRLIRIDDPDIGSNPLVVDLTALEASGRTSPFITLASTFGLTSITGNGTNAVRLEGTLANINAALSHVTFYTVDDGNFTFTVTASDLPNGESGSNSLQVVVANASPQIVIGSTGGNEGSLNSAVLEVFDPGSVDQVQINWTVKYEQMIVAQGTGTSVQFFASASGFYQVTATAVDKDGGISGPANAEVRVENVSPRFELTGFFRDNVAHLRVVIDDPGLERFQMAVVWNTEQGVEESFEFDQKVFEFSHEYTPAELKAATNLNIAVSIRDDGDIARQSLQFREESPQDVAPPKFETPPPPTPPERNLPERPEQSSTTPQGAAASFGPTATQGRQDDAVVQQFVLRVVSPDGEESGDYVLPAEALDNLPAFLSTLGVPDGHYRIYLVTGDLERLMIDAHLRAGRMFDPRDGSQPTFDQPPVSLAEAASGRTTPSLAASQAAIVATTTALAAPSATSAADEQPAEDPFDSQMATSDEGHAADEQGDSLLPQFGPALAVGATAVIVAAGRSSKPSQQTERLLVRRYTKAARLARRLIRLQ